MVEEFDLPTEIIDRKVTKMKMISPSNREVDVGKTLSEREYIGMCRREVFDDFLRNRAKGSGATVLNGLMMGFTQEGNDGPFKLRYNDFSGGGKVWRPANVCIAACGSTLRARGVAVRWPLLPCVPQADWRSSACAVACLRAGRNRGEKRFSSAGGRAK